MARQNSLNIHDTKGVNALLAESYGKVIENINTGTISQYVKNYDLSGNPESGSVEAKRFANATAEDYGTARAGGKAKGVVADTVTVKIDTHKELLEEVEAADVAFYGIESLVARRNNNIAKTGIKLLEKKFWDVAVDAATEIVTSETSITKIMDAAINTLETTKNKFVDGIDRDMLHLIVDPTTYTAIQNKLDELPKGTSPTDGVIKMFHNVKLFMSTDLPTGVKFLAGVDGSVAQSVLHARQPYTQIPLSKAYAFGLFLDYGTQVVMPELLLVYKEGGTTGDIKVTDILVYSETGLTSVAVGDDLQMIADVSPTNATNKSVIWQVENGTGEAKINTNGLLTGDAPGTVTVKAIANDDSGVIGTQLITVTE